MFYKILFILLFGFSLCYAENKIYYDNSNNKEVVDVSGQKTLEQINSEFKGNFTDVTQARKDKAETDKIAFDNTQKDKQDKIKLLIKSSSDKLKALGFNDNEIAVIVK